MIWRTAAWAVVILFRSVSLKRIAKRVQFGVEMLVRLMWESELWYEDGNVIVHCAGTLQHYSITIRGDFLFENAKWLNAKRGGKLYNNCWKLKFLQPFFSASPNHVIWASLGTQNTAFILLYFHIILVSHFLLSSIVIVGLLKEQQ